MDSQEKPTGRFYGRWWFWVLVVLVVGIILSALSSTSSTASESAITSACAGLSPDASQPIDYKELSKNPDTFKSNQTTFMGQVIQIQESNGVGFMRLAVDKDSFGWNTSDIVLVDYQGHTDAVENDVVTVGGIMEGSQTYTSQANFQITVPLMYACSIQEASTTAVKPSAPTTSKSTGIAKQPTAPVTQAPVAPPATWHTVTTLSGQTQKNSPPFTIKGSQWRISWQETGDGFFGATAESPDESGSYCAIANLVGSGSDSTYCYDPGTYYVSVNTANSWTITVEDYY